MEVEIIEKKDNKFFEREEYKANVVFEKATPSREEIKNNLITRMKKARVGCNKKDEAACL
jgi:ribosomal protein S24E